MCLGSWTHPLTVNTNIPDFTTCSPEVYLFSYWLINCHYHWWTTEEHRYHGKPNGNTFTILQVCGRNSHGRCILVQALTVTSFVTWHKFMRKKQMPLYYDQALIYNLPSHRSNKVWCFLSLAHHVIPRRLVTQWNVTTKCLFVTRLQSLETTGNVTLMHYFSLHATDWIL